MATHIKEVIAGFLKQNQRKASKQSRIEKIIGDFLTDDIKQHAFLKAATQNNIVLGLDSSGAAYNLDLIKEGLLKEIQKQFPEIKKITLRTGAK